MMSTRKFSSRFFVSPVGIGKKAGKMTAPIRNKIDFLFVLKL